MGGVARLVREWAGRAVTPPAPHLPFTFHRLDLTFTLYEFVFRSHFLFSSFKLPNYLFIYHWTSVSNSKSLFSYR